MADNAPLLIFDLDGTLVDSREDIAASLNHGLMAVQLAPLSLEHAQSFIGRPLEDIFRTLTGDEEKTIAASAAYREHFFKHCADKSRLYDGVLETLQTLNGSTKKAVATTKRRFMAVRVIEAMGLAPYFDYVEGTDGFPAKPNPEILLRLLARFETDPSRAWMIGDTAADVLAGKQAGMRVAAVRYGIGSTEELSALNPDLLLTDFRQVAMLTERIPG